MKKKNKEESKKNNDKSKKNIFSKFNYKKNYKKLMILPVLMFIFAIFSIVSTMNTEHTPIYRDVTLKGGLSAVITVNTSVTPQQFKNYLEKNHKNSSFSINEVNSKGKRIGFIVETDLNEKEFLKSIDSFFKTKFISGKNYTSNYISASLSDSFFRQSLYILAISFILMSIVIFLYFKEPVPSGSVVLSAIFDILFTVGVLDFFKVKVSIAGIGALLMLIGYSIDTDVLLTNRLIREEGENYFHKAYTAFVTGSLMSITTLAAGASALIFTNSEVIYQIALILVIGLVTDFISTWIQNTGILLWWIEKRKIK